MRSRLLKCDGMKTAVAHASYHKRFIFNPLEYNQITRKHSSRMRTVRFSSRLLEGCLPRGGVSGGGSAQSGMGGSLPAVGCTPPPVDRQTPAKT